MAGRPTPAVPTTRETPPTHRWLRTRGLTAAEAAGRGARISGVRYCIHVDLTDLAGGRFRSTTTVTFDDAAPHQPIWLDLIADRVMSLRADGADLDLAAAVGVERLVLARTAAHTTVEVVADHRAGDAAAGLCRSVDPTDGAVYAWTQFQPFDARRMFPCFDQPDLRAVVTLSVRAPAGWTCVANAARTAEWADGTGTRHEFAPTPPIPTYLVALCAGPFAAVHGRHGELPLALYARRSLAEVLQAAAPELFALTGTGLDLFTAHFGRGYPGTKYDHVFLPDQPGAMENLGCVTWNDEVLYRSAPTPAQRARRALVLLHELSHQWFGDLVSPRWWDDLWLSESFADWAAIWALRFVPELAAHAGDGVALLKPTALRADQLPSSHPVSQPVADVAAVAASFDAITYHKGAYLLHRLVDRIGEDAFLAGLRGYFRRFAWGCATIDGLVEELSAATPVDVRRWADEWLRTAGVNTIRLRVDTAGGRCGSVRIEQTGPVLRTHQIQVTAYRLVDRRLRPVAVVAVTVEGSVTDVRALAGRPAGEVLLPDSAGDGYLKVRPDPESWRALRDWASALDPGPARAVVRQLVADLLFDAELGAADALAMLLDAAATEPGAAEFAATVDLAVVTAHRYASVAERAALSARIADRCLPMAADLRHTPAHRAAAWSAAARSACTAAQLDALAAALPTADLPQPVRWEVATRLVSAEPPGSGLVNRWIGAARRLDPDPDGWIAAAAAACAAPTDDAKDSGLALLFDHRRLPAGRIAQVAAALWQPLQPAASRRAAARYLAGLPGAVRAGGPARALRLVSGGFPTAGLDDDLVRAARRLADDRSLPAAVRSALTDEAALAERTIRTARRPA